LAEVASDHVPEPDEVALVERPVQPELLAHRLDLVRRRLRPQDDQRRVARDQVRHQEGQERDQQDDRDHVQQAQQEVARHPYDSQTVEKSWWNCGCGRNPWTRGWWAWAIDLCAIIGPGANSTTSSEARR